MDRLKISYRDYMDNLRSSFGINQENFDLEDDLLRRSDDFSVKNNRLKRKVNYNGLDFIIEKGNCLDEVHINWIIKFLKFEGNFERLLTAQLYPLNNYALEEFIFEKSLFETDNLENICYDLGCFGRLSRILLCDGTTDNFILSEDDNIYRIDLECGLANDSFIPIAGHESVTMMKIVKANTSQYECFKNCFKDGLKYMDSLIKAKKKELIERISFSKSYPDMPWYVKADKGCNITSLSPNISKDPNEIYKVCLQIFEEVIDGYYD